MIQECSWHGFGPFTEKGFKPIHLEKIQEKSNILSLIGAKISQFSTFKKVSNPSIEITSYAPVLISQAIINSYLWMILDLMSVEGLFFCGLGFNVYSQTMVWPPDRLNLHQHQDSESAPVKKSMLVIFIRLNQNYPKLMKWLLIRICQVTFYNKNEFWNLTRIWNDVNVR